MLEPHITEIDRDDDTVVYEVSDDTYSARVVVNNFEKPRVEWGKAFEKFYQYKDAHTKRQRRITVVWSKLAFCWLELVHPQATQYSAEVLAELLTRIEIKIIRVVRNVEDYSAKFPIAIFADISLDDKRILKEGEPIYYLFVFNDALNQAGLISASITEMEVEKLVKLPWRTQLVLDKTRLVFRPVPFSENSEWNGICYHCFHITDELVRMRVCERCGYEHPHNQFDEGDACCVKCRGYCYPTNQSFCPECGGEIEENEV